MNRILLVIALLWMGNALLAQSGSSTQHYFVYFQDKDLTQSPVADFSEKAIQRREKAGVAFPMWEDFAVNPSYINAVGQLVTRPRHTLRWFNALSVEATEAQVDAVRKLPFVRLVQTFEDLEVVLAGEEAMDDDGSEDSLELHTLFNLQREMVGMEMAESQGLSGKGLLIAVFDAGFTGADEHTALAHLFKNGQIKATHDFIGNDAEVYANSGHGTAVLSCIAGMYEGKRIGAATDALFLLARTERNIRETKQEEDNWMAAMEWADREGADIISSSLGYARPRYKYEDMDGRRTLVSQAAAMAVRKGILVVNSAGNEGANTFHYISAPSDADSVLTVAGSYPMVQMKMPFSSIGPNARGLLKPEIAAPGYVLAAHRSGRYRAFAGTSFACPLLTGLAACLMQRYPDSTNMEIKHIIMQAGHTWPYYDYALGYGVFSMNRAMTLDTFPTETFSVEKQGDTTWFFLDTAVVHRDTLKHRNGKPLSYHFFLPGGKLTSYKTILIRPNFTRFGIGPAQRTEGKMAVWFEGYLWREDE
jgi:serine protease AprX